MTERKTYCFGRFLIDLPKDAEINGQAYEYMFGKIESEPFTGGETAFEKKMKERESQLETGKHNDKFKLIGATVLDSLQTHIFKLRKKLIVNESFGFEAYRLVNSTVLFSMKETAFDANGIDSVLQRLETHLLPKLRFRRPDEIPNEPGFCIKDGFIADDGKTPQFEDAGISFKFKQWPDVSIVVGTRTNRDKLEESLLTRIKKPIPEAFVEVEKEVRHFREGSHNVGPMRGEESLITLPTDNGYGVHHFVWEALGEPRTTLAPLVHLDFNTGEGRSINQRYMRPSLTDKQAIELFDTIVNSIRLRPTTPGKSSDAGKPSNFDNGDARRLPLGAHVSSFRSCPETGVYECPADTPGVNARRVLVQAGRPMPSAFIAQARQGIAGLLGTQESKEVEVIWTLVAYSEGS